MVFWVVSVVMVPVLTSVEVRIGMVEIVSVVLWV